VEFVMASGIHIIKGVEDVANAVHLCGHECVVAQVSEFLGTK
jgi:hypothetical protein